MRAALITLLFLCSLCGHASAAVYWGDGGAIGRVNSDLSYLEPYLIGAVNAVDIAGACGVAVNGTHIFWGDRGHGMIGRSNLDGTNPHYSFITGASEPCGVALDGSYIYWASRGSNSIGRAKLDGSESTNTFVNGVDTPCGIAVDSAFIYWASMKEGNIGRALIENGVKGPPLVEGEKSGLCGVAVNKEHIFWGGYRDVIGRANLDGSEPNLAFIQGVNRPCSVAVDGSHVYWTEEGSGGGGQIGRASLDGTAVNRGLVTGLRFPCGIAADSVVFPPPPVSVPLAEKSLCSVSSVYRNKRDGTAVLEMEAAAHGEIRIKTRGLKWRILNRERPPWHHGWQKWRIKIWPAKRGVSAMQIRHQLKHLGRAPLKVRLWCQGEDEGDLPTTKVKRVTLVRRSSR